MSDVCRFEGLAISSELDTGVVALNIDLDWSDPTYTAVILMKVRSLIDSALDRRAAGHSDQRISLHLDPEGIKGSLRGGST